MASKFAGIGNWHDFLPYWIGKEKYIILQENVRERRKKIKDSDEDIFVILSHVFKKYQEGRNFLSPYLTDDEAIEREISEEVTELDHAPVMSALGLGDELSPIAVLQRLDTIIAIEKTKRNPRFESGRYWIVSYSQEVIKSTARPFVVLAKIDCNDNIEYLQGAWPLAYTKNALDRVVPMPYESTLQDMRYVKITVEETITRVRDGKAVKIDALGYRHTIEPCE